jgi:hypothetical protein
MDKTGRGFEFVMNKVPNVSDAKIKEGIFTGPQIRELMQDKQFDEDLNVQRYFIFVPIFATMYMCMNPVPN